MFDRATAATPSVFSFDGLDDDLRRTERLKNLNNPINATQRLRDAMRYRINPSDMLRPAL